MKRTRRASRSPAAALAFALTLLFGCRSAHGYIRVSYSLGRIMSESAFVTVFSVTQVERGKNVVTYRKVRDIKGVFPDAVLVHSIGMNGEFSSQGKGAPGTFLQSGARDWRDIMAWADVGKNVVVFCSPNGSQAEICLGDYWYQAWKEGAGWRMIHAEPTFALAFAGRTASLIKALEAMLSGQEVVISCMAPSDVSLLIARTARLQRMKASLKLQDYNSRRDFVGWGGDSGNELRPVVGMPGFTHYGMLATLGPGPVGVAAADFTGDGKPDLCLYGEQRVVLMENRDGAFSEVFPSIDGGARAAAWGDANGDGWPDLLLATPAGPRLLINEAGKFVESTTSLPSSPYPYVTAAAWIGGAGALQNILLADGFRGLRLYRNRTAKGGASSAGPTGKWFYAGPFDNTGGNGFAAVYPPEKGVDLGAQYAGKGGTKVTWREGNFTDGQANDLALFAPEHNENSVVYLYRELEFDGAADLPVSLGSDDTLSVWFNGQPVHAENVARGCAPDQALLTLKIRPGRNTLLLKICQGSGSFGFYFASKLPAAKYPKAFEDVSDAVGLGAGGAAGTMAGDHLAVADVNGDGLDDVLFSAGSGVLLLNTPRGFGVAPNAGIAYRAGGVVPAFGDFNGDGRPDLFVPQATGPSRLFLNDGAGRFRDVTDRAGDLAKPLGQAACAVWSDFCKRGRADLLVGCLRGQNRYFRNNGNGTFTDAGDEVGLYQSIYNTGGLCVLDVNQDGVPDLIMGNAGGESAFLLGSRDRLASDAAPGTSMVPAKKDENARKGLATYASTALR